MRTHYDVLGVPASASAEDVKRAYHRMARRHHPDVRAGSGGDPMVEVNAAWAVLGDPVRRGNYDRELARRTTATEPRDVDAEDVTLVADFAGFGGQLDPDPEPRPYTPAAWSLDSYGKALTLASSRNSSALRCWKVPMPAEA